MSAAQIAQALAGHKVQARNGNYLICCPAHDDDSPSLSLCDGDRGVKVHCFAGCSPADIYRAIRRRGHKLLEPGDTAPQPVKGSSEYQRRQREKATWMWGQRSPLVGSLAEHYVRVERGYTGPLPATLGYLRPFKREYRPALIAAVTNKVDEPEPGVLGKPHDVDCVHLTLLNDDGTKAEATRKLPNKLLVGSPYIRDPVTDKIIASRPVIVAPPNDLLGLCICEGIEDALSAHAATGLGAWAGIGANFMAHLGPLVPSYITAVTIFAHPDEAGEQSARTLADALRKRGVEVVVEGIA